jgi:hypothetical protein
LWKVPHADEPTEIIPFCLGETQIVEVKKDPLPMIYVANMVAQTLGGARLLFYNHLARCMDTVAKFALTHKDVRIVCPAFGAGLAGGHWPFVESLIEDCWLRRGIPATVYYLANQKPEGLILRDD